MNATANKPAAGTPQEVAQSLANNLQRVTSERTAVHAAIAIKHLTKAAEAADRGFITTARVSSREAKEAINAARTANDISVRKASPYAHHAERNERGRYAKEVERITLAFTNRERSVETPAAQSAYAIVIALTKLITAILRDEHAEQHLQIIASHETTHETILRTAHRTTPTTLKPT
jgi:hypothetical protein